MMIHTENICFAYSKNKPLLQNLTLDVPVGSIYGFIGKNGSGKSTTIRLLLGLLEPQSGMLSVMGKDMLKNSQCIRKKTGFLIEYPVFYKHLTCHENLKLLSCYYHFEQPYIEKMLRLVDLWNDRHVLFEKCSTGMQQRLGIAKSFIHNPELLILDEPLNGLDPEWVAEIRAILKKINEMGVTIFFSSHLLGEMEKLATHIGILKDGKMQTQSSIKDLLNSKITKVSVQLSATANMDSLFISENIQLQIEDNRKVTFFLQNGSNLHELVSTLVTNGFIIEDLLVHHPDLEEIFLQLNN